MLWKKLLPDIINESTNFKLILLLTGLTLNFSIQKTIARKTQDQQM